MFSGMWPNGTRESSCFFRCVHAFQKCNFRLQALASLSANLQVLAFIMENLAKSFPMC